MPVSFNGDRGVIPNLESDSVIQATISSIYETKESAQAKGNTEFVVIESLVDEVGLGVNELAKLVEQAKIKKN